MGFRGRVVSTPDSIPLQRIGERVRFPSLPCEFHVSLLCCKKFLVVILYMVMFSVCWTYVILCGVHWIYVKKRERERESRISGMLNWCPVVLLRMSCDNLDSLTHPDMPNIGYFQLFGPSLNLKLLTEIYLLF